MIKASASQNLQKRTKRLSIIMAALLGLGAVTIFLLMFFSYNQVKKAKELRQQQDSQVQSDAATQEIESYIVSNEQDVRSLVEAFPTEESFVNVLQVIEGLSRQYDANATVELSAFSPNKVNNQLSVPLVIKLNATTSELTQLLREIERLPFVMEVVSITSQFPGGITNKAEISIGVRLYVNDPFTQP